MIVNLCILWRFLVTWIHANVLTAHLVRELFRHQGPYLLHLILWRFPRMFSGFALHLAMSSCALLSVVSPSGCSVAQVDVETMVAGVLLVDLQLLSVLVPVPACFFCLTL